MVDHCGRLKGVPHKKCVDNPEHVNVTLLGKWSYVLSQASLDEIILDYLSGS